MRAFLLLLLCLTSSARGEVRKLTILHTNDLHARVIPDEQGRGGFAEIAAVLRAQREDCNHCLHLGAGDLITGMPLSTLFQGLPVFEIANRMGFDAFTLGNHEFDHGWRHIVQFRNKANFPIVSANALGADNRTIADAPYTILRANGLRVGVIGLIMGNLSRLLTPETLGPVHTKPVVEAARDAARELAGRVDIVVALGHIHLEEGSAILREAPEVAVVVGGHNHGGRDELDRFEGRVGVALRAYGVEVGRLDLEVDTGTKRLTSAEWARIPVRGSPRAPDVERLVQRWEDRVAHIVDQPIGETWREFSRNDVRELIERATLDEMHADFTHMNRGGVRDILPKGQIRIRHWFNIMPFENKMMLARVRGAQVSEALRAGRPVEPDKEYVVALMDYAVENPALREELALEGMRFQPTGRLLRDLLIDWTRKKKVLE
jgi:2',3'-cyclic-nucleotide 2'-phosphodiesterase (5'-nucleotidase family)